MARGNAFADPAAQLHADLAAAQAARSGPDPNLPSPVKQAVARGELKPPNGGSGLLGEVASKALGLGTGLVDLGRAAVAPGTHPSWGQLAHDWNPASWIHGNNPVTGTQAKQDALARQETGMVTNVVHHPLDPANLLLLEIPGAAGLLARADYAVRAGRAGELGNAAKVLTPLHRPPMPLRELQVPKLRGPAVGPANLEHETAHLHASQAALPRAAQAVHDKVVQGALNRSVRGKSGPLTRYAQGRVAGALGEQIRTSHNLSHVPASELNRLAQRPLIRSALGRNGFDKGLSRPAAELAVFLRSANVLGHEAAAHWQQVAPRLARRAQQLEDQGVLKLNGAGHVHVSSDFPKLARADAVVKEAQRTRGSIITEHHLMTPEGQQERLDLVGKVLNGGRYNPATKAVEGGEAARGGQGFTPLATSRRSLPQSLFQMARGNVIPGTKPFSVGKRATGRGVAEGVIPTSPIRGVAEKLAEALRFQNTVHGRGLVARYGSDTHPGGRQVLVRDPALTKQGHIPPRLEELLGKKESTLTPDEEVGLAKAMRAVVEDAIPGLTDKFQEDLSRGRGERAPEGYRWVPHHMVPSELIKTAEARDGFERGADEINSAVTAATVYLKLGHVPTRVFTNAFTNAMQGSGLLAPVGLGKSARTLRQLTNREHDELAALTGGHGYQALPQRGKLVGAKVARRGANWWAQHVDRPFRLNSILYELRQVGVETPDQIRGALKTIHSRDFTSPEGAKIAQAIRESNRAAIMYDGLSNAEKRYVARYLWFYPWTKGATRYAFHVAANHPLKATALSQVAQEGAQHRDQVFGALPPYELGLTPLSGGPRPWTTNISSYTPISTVGDVAELVQHPGDPDRGILGQFNPVYAGLINAVKSATGGKSSVRDLAVAFFHEATAPTPEAQIISAWLAGPSKAQQQIQAAVKAGLLTKAEGARFSAAARQAAQRQKIFGVPTVLGTALRAGGGAGVPRQANVDALNAQAVKNMDPADKLHYELDAAVHAHLLTQQEADQMAKQAAG